MKKKQDALLRYFKPGTGDFCHRRRRRRRARYLSPLSIKTPHLLEVIKTERAVPLAYFTLTARLAVPVCDSNPVNQRRSVGRSFGWLVTSRDDSDTRPAIIHSASFRILLRLGYDSDILPRDSAGIPPPPPLGRQSTDIQF